MSLRSESGSPSNLARTNVTMGPTSKFSTSSAPTTKARCKEQKTNIAWVSEEASPTEEEMATVKLVVVVCIYIMVPSVSQKAECAATANQKVNDSGR